MGVPRPGPNPPLSWRRPAAPRRADADRVTARVQTELLGEVDALKARTGTGQEQGSEAGGPEVNLRREALAALRARMSLAELEALLPKRGAKVLKNLARDLDWIEAAERQGLAAGKPFDFSWSKNPMSTPSVLKGLAAKRAVHAAEQAAAIAEDPSCPYDASNDSLLGHLQLDDADLRSQVLADTLIQFRAKRRSEALMDADVAPDPERRAQGRMGSSGTVSAYEQRLAAQSIEPGRGLAAKREYALARLTIGGAVAGSVNGIYKGRNAVGNLTGFIGRGVAYDAIDEAAGFSANFHDAIHKSYSANTPAAVEHFVKRQAFTDGAVEDRPYLVRGLVDAANAEHLDDARATLAALERDYGYAVPGLDAAATQDALKTAIGEHFRANTRVEGIRDAHPVGAVTALGLVATTYEAVVLDRPTVDELEKNLFFAQSAAPQVAQLIAALERDDPAAQLEAIGRARTALKAAFFDVESGYARQMLWRLDRRVELLATELLGTAVERAHAEAPDVGEALVAVRSALRNVNASELGALRGRKKTAPVEDLTKLEREVGRMIDSGGATVEELRALMTKVFASATEVADAMSVYFRRRESAIRFSDVDVELDPDFTGNLVKETPLQHLLSLSNHLRTLGTKTEISAEQIRFVGGMRVLNSTGPRVYERILVAKTPEALKRYAPTVDDLCVVRSAEEKNLVYGGGLVLDTKDAGPGLAHAAVFAKGHGINAIALPNLDDVIEKFFDKAKGDGPHPGFYVDPRAESFVIKPLSAAVSEGLVRPSEVDRLRPGFNLDVDFFDVTAAAERVLVESRERHLSDAHETRRITLFVPDLDDGLGLGGPASFATLGAHPIDRVRQAAGEKGAVLVELAKSERLAALGVEVPDGGVVPPFSVASLLSSTEVGGKSLMELWDAAPNRAGFDDPKKRLGQLARLKKTSSEALKGALVDGNKPTALGRQLLADFADRFALADGDDWIFRSSFTAEDRPNKSGAGQYDSAVVPAKPKRTLARRRLEAVADVIASAWNASAVESNLAANVPLEHVWPSIVVQRALDPTVSGVGCSRGPTGGFGEVSYQATPKFGGGVDGGACEEGTLSSRDAALHTKYEDRDTSLLDAEQQRLLREAILAIEEEFHERIEPGQGHAVDVEWAFVGETLHILQARVLTGV